MKKILILIFWIVSIHSFAQEKTILVLKTMPLSVCASNVYLGMEMLPYAKRTSIELGGAVFIPNMWSGTRIKDHNGFKIKTEIRYYIKHKNTEKAGYTGFYLADEICFRSEKYKRYDAFIHFDKSTGEAIDYYDFELINRQEIRNGLKFGYQAVFFSTIVLDSYLGMGINYHVTKFEKKITDPECCRVVRLFEQSTNTGIGYNIIAGIKIGYLLRKLQK